MGRRVLVAALLLLTTIGAAAQCAPTGGDPSVTICSPASGSSNGILHIAAATNSSSSVDLMQIYLNGHKRWEKAVNALDIKLIPWAGGAYHITVKAHDTSGRWFQSSVDANVDQTVTFDQACPTGLPPRSVAFCIPIDGEVIWSPYMFRNEFTPNDSGQLARASQLYLDGVQIWESGSRLWPFPPGPLFPPNEYPLPLGLHRLTFQGYDSLGAFKASIFVRVTSVNKACPLPAAQPAVEICSLTEGQTATSPVRVAASGNAKKGVWLMQIYVDRQKVFEDGKAWVDKSLTMTPGTHRVTVQGSSDGLTFFNQTVNITVQ